MACARSALARWLPPHERAPPACSTSQPATGPQRAPASSTDGRGVPRARSSLHVRGLQNPRQSSCFRRAPAAARSQAFGHARTDQEPLLGQPLLGSASGGALAGFYGLCTRAPRQGPTSASCFWRSAASASAWSARCAISAFRIAPSVMSLHSAASRRRCSSAPNLPAARACGPFQQAAGAHVRAEQLSRTPCQPRSPLGHSRPADCECAQEQVGVAGAADCESADPCV